MQICWNSLQSVLFRVFFLKLKKCDPPRKRKENKKNKPPGPYRSISGNNRNAFIVDAMKGNYSSRPELNIPLIKAKSRAGEQGQ